MTVSAASQVRNTTLRQKYLKYKQKYIELKNRINNK